jgi:predicted TIM-barrel fold metal-dependent hydrolase
MLINLPLIDIHTHIGHLPGVVGDVTTPQDLCYIAEHEGAQWMLASSASASTINQHYATLEVVEMVKQHADRLGGMLWINPHDPAWHEDVKLAVQYHFLGIKIHPVLDHYEVDRRTLDDVFNVAQEHSWPILTHTDVDGSTMDADCYEPLIQAYPDVILILAHLRWGAIPLAKRYSNVFVDTTYMDPRTIEIGVDALGPGKILFGSDAAEGFDVGHTPGRIRPRRSYAGLIDGLRARGISESALEKILFANSKAIFHLPDR